MEGQNSDLTRLNLDLEMQRPIPPAPSLSYHEKRIPPPDLLSASAREDYISICVPLYEASLKGDWGTAKDIIAKKPDVIRMSLTKNRETALHIAASARRTHFVEELVKMMTSEDLTLQNKNDNTALCLAAAAGTVEIAEIMVKKNNYLPCIRGSQNMTPLYMAALFGHGDMVSYLYGMTQKLRGGIWTDEDRSGILKTCVDAELYDIALDIVQNHPLIAQRGDALHVLVRKPFAFTAKVQNFFWRSVSSIRHFWAAHV